MRKSFALLLIFIFQNAFGDSNDYPVPDFQFKNLDTFISPTRLEQARKDLPSSITVISKNDLDKLGVTSIPEALRLVSGMFVGKASGNDYRISYHGTASQAPRRMQVLVDGVSIYQPAFARVDWVNIPVSFNNIKSIEVTKNPNSASYGANSFFGIVNIKTFYPEDMLNKNIGSGIDSNGNLTGHFSFSSRSGNVINNISGERTIDNGYDTNFLDEERFDGYDNYKLGIQSFMNHNNTEILISAYAVKGTNEIEFIDDSQAFPPERDIEYSTFNFSISHPFSKSYELRINSYYARYEQDEEWVSCFSAFQLIPELADLYLVDRNYVSEIIQGNIPSGGSSEADLLASQVLQKAAFLGNDLTTTVCGRANNNNTQEQTKFEIQNTYNFNEAFRTVFGLTYINNEADSRTYFGGKSQLESYHLFFHSEYRWNNLVTYNLGFLWESDEYNQSISPRTSVNFHLSDYSTLRFSISKAIRTPDALEQNGLWSYELSELSPDFFNENGTYYINADSPGGLEPEEIISYEIGLFRTDVSNRGFLDIKVFHDELDNLISERLLLYDFIPTNTTSGYLSGSELEYTTSLTPKLVSKITYAYLDNNIDSEQEKLLYSRHSGAIYFTYTDNWFYTFAYYGSDQLAGHWFGKMDLTLGKEFEFEKSKLLFYTTLSRYLNNDGRVNFGTSRNIEYENNYDSNTILKASVKLTF